MEKIFDAQEGEKIEGVRYPIKPWLKADALEGIDYNIGTYNTDIKGSQGRRKKY